MTAPRSGTVASLSRFCRVCDGRRVVQVVRLLDPAIAGSGRSRCPHCSATRDENPLPIYDYPMRAETPKDVA